VDIFVLFFVSLIIAANYLNYVGQCGPTTGPRAVCDLPQHFQWPVEAFRKNLLISNLLKSMWCYVCLT